MIQIIFLISISIVFAAQIKGVPHSLDGYFGVWFFWLQFPLGAMSILFLHELTGGKWGDDSRRYFKAMVASLWPLVILFFPLLIFSEKFWGPSPLYTQFFFSIRAIVYFVILLILAKLTLSSKRPASLPAWGLFLYLITISLFTTDWAMARDSGWYSTTYALIWALSMTMSPFALMLIFKSFHQRTMTESNADQGSVFLIFIVSWAYLAFMQFLIIWSANLPKEVIWYLKRMDFGWQYIVIAVAIGSLLIPFFLLLNHKLKLDSKNLAWIAALVLFFRVLDCMWMLLPAGRPQLTINFWDILSFLGIGGLWLSIFYRYLKKSRQEVL